MLKRKYLYVGLAIMTILISTVVEAPSLTPASFIDVPFTEKCSAGVHY